MNLNNDYLLKDRLKNDEIQRLLNLKYILTEFIQNHKKKSIILLTSGGTSVPLQKNTVRSIQNFSTGLRGSLLAQTILQHDQPLIYFYRDKSFLPYSKGITINQALISQNFEQMEQLIKGRNKYLQKKNKILLIPFSSIYFYLNGIIQIKKYLPSESIIILCAAVSDFIPKYTPTHKITTSQQIALQLQSVPKILKQMISPNLLCVSFKLETDQKKISERIQFAIQKYNVDMVVGNLLGNKNWVHLQFNQQRFKEKKYIEYINNIEQNLWKQILIAHKQLFQHQIKSYNQQIQIKNDIIQK